MIVDLIMSESPEEFIQRVQGLEHRPDNTLMAAAMIKSYETGNSGYVSFLTSMGHSPFYVSEEGDTLLHELARMIAANNGSISSELAVISRLVSILGLDYNAVNIYGETMAELSGYQPLIDYVNNRASVFLIESRGSLRGLPSDIKNQLRGYLL
jgi:ankyrin repeat protein